MQEIPEPGRDPWLIGGLVLLAVLSVGALQLYRSAPQTLADAGTRGLVAVRPSAFGPRLRRAEERFTTAEAAREARQDSVAMVNFGAAAEQAWTARGFADSPADSSAALNLWSRAVLARTELLLQAGTGPWWRRDDNERLQEALASAQRVLAEASEPDLRQRAEALRRETERRLRPGPLEWLPPRR